MTLEELEKFEAILDRDFAEVRERVKRAIDACPKKVTLEEALKQVKEFGGVD